MKLRYIINDKKSYEQKNFTFNKEYKVIADYRQRQSGQQIQDNGFVVIDDKGQTNMLFQNEVEIIADDEKCYTFNYKK